MQLLRSPRYRSRPRKLQGYTLRRGSGCLTLRVHLMPHFVTRCSDVPITNLSFGVWISIPLLPF